MPAVALALLVLVMAMLAPVYLAFRIMPQPT